MAKRKEHERASERDLIPRKYHHRVAVGAILLSLVIFFHEAIFSGKVFDASDNIASQSFRPFLEQAEKEGVFPLWVPYIFGGMPSYASLLTGPPRVYDLTETIVRMAQKIFTAILTNEEVTRVVFYYFIFGISMYFFMIHKKKSPLPSLFTSLAAVFSTYIIIWIMVGHNTKIASLCLFPTTLMIVEMMIEDFRWWHGIVLMVAIHVQQLASHIQLFFYMYLLIGIYLLYLIAVRAAQREPWLPVLRSGIVFAVAAGFSFAMSADLYLSTLEYNPYSIRGSNPIMHTSTTAQTKTAEGGLDYDYATNWSFSPGEMLTFFIPSLYGFGIQEYRGPIFNNQPTRLPTYWGQMPFTDAPQYMGIVVLALAILGIYYHRKDRFVQAMLIICVLSLLISFGREFSPMYDLMYYYFPMFNKFRVPSMILVLLQVVAPILAGYGLQSVFDKAKGTLSPVAEKRFKYILLGILALLALGVVGKPVYNDFYKGFVGNDGLNKILSIFGNQPENVLAQIRPMMYDFIFGSVMNDYYAMLVLLLATFGILYALRRQKISTTTAGTVIILLSMIDLWRVDTKPMEFKEKSVQANTFATPDYVMALSKDTSLYRVLNTENFQHPSNTLAYFKLQSIGGYHGAKIRIYQDMVDVAGLNNPMVWELMNTKYILADVRENTPGLPTVFNGREKKILAFPNGSDRAWFVDSMAIDSGLGILTRIKNNTFNPHHMAYVEQNPGVAIDPPSASAGMRVRSFGIHHISFEATASGNNLLFVSEIYYPKGWNATIDGKPTEVYKTNYAFRSVVVPKGTHIVEFKFEPAAYPLGRSISLATNILAWCGILTVGFFRWREKKKASTEGGRGSVG